MYYIPSINYEINLKERTEKNEGGLLRSRHRAGEFIYRCFSKSLQKFNLT